MRKGPTAVMPWTPSPGRSRRRRLLLGFRLRLRFLRRGFFIAFIVLVGLGRLVGRLQLFDDGLKVLLGFPAVGTAGLVDAGGAQLDANGRGFDAEFFSEFRNAVGQLFFGRGGGFLGHGVFSSRLAGFSFSSGRISRRNVFLLTQAEYPRQ